VNNLMKTASTKYISCKCHSMGLHVGKWHWQNQVSGKQYSNDALGDNSDTEGLGFKM